MVRGLETEGREPHEKWFKDRLFCWEIRLVPGYLQDWDKSTKKDLNITGVNIFKLSIKVKLLNMFHLPILTSTPL